jgi:hypothetical protein
VEINDHKIPQSGICMEGMRKTMKNQAGYRALNKIHNRDVESITTAENSRDR